MATLVKTIERMRKNRDRYLAQAQRARDAAEKISSQLARIQQAVTPITLRDEMDQAEVGASLFLPPD